MQLPLRCDGGDLAAPLSAAGRGLTRSQLWYQWRTSYVFAGPPHGLFGIESRMKRLPPNSRSQRLRLKWYSAVYLGFGMQLIMTMTVALCALGPRTPASGLYVFLSIAACLVLQILIALAAYYKDMVWPANLIYFATACLIAVGSTLAFKDHQVFEHQTWLLCFDWLCTIVILTFATIETFEYDFGISIPDRSFYRRHPRD